MSEEFKPGLFRKPGQIGMYGSPEFLAAQSEAIDVLTGNKSWTDEDREYALKHFRGEMTSEEIIKERLTKLGVNYEV